MTSNQLPQVDHLTTPELLELRTVATDQRLWYAVSRELASRAEGPDWRTPIAEATSDPEPDRITDPGGWHAWRRRIMMRAPV